MRRRVVWLLAPGLIALNLGACSGSTAQQGASSGGSTALGSAGLTGATAGGGGGTAMSGSSGTTGAVIGGAGGMPSGGVATGGTQSLGGSAGMNGGGTTTGGGGTGGTSASAGTAGTGGTAGGGLGSLATVPIMVLGSSNEIGTCWRAFLWQKLQMANITNVDFVGGVTTGPDCAVPGYDKDLQAQNGNMVSDLTANDFAGWFTAHPPLIILEHFGGADILSGRPVDGVIAGFTLALQQARMVNPHVHFMAGLHTPQTADVQPLNAAAVIWAAQNTTPESPVTTVDLYSIIDPATDLPDGVHLNDMGSMKVAGAWFDALQPLFQ
ncbi:MAG TPA: hypothetical protein VL137_00760 [Polyangiaceae bacterium]|nr:hypothetical protein [Polyangiaceae bacterium]